jgi:ABC-type Fe3+-siderophore transport system, permease component
MSKNRIYIIIAVILVMLLIADLLLGSVILPVKHIFAAITGGEAPQYIRDIILYSRVPKIATALLAGVALSICGLQMQTLFRNPLADPYILGISSGAGLGVAIFIMGFSAFGVSLASSVLTNIGVAVAAWIGALTVTAIVLIVSARLRSSISLLVFGIMLGSASSAVISLIQYFSNSNELKSYTLWTMGSFSGLTASQVLILFLLVLAGLVISIYNIKDLNAIISGETYAKSLGVNIERVRRRILIATTILAGGVTAFCGPIGFVGIAVPHIARMVFKDANHKVLIPATALLGAAVMVFADTVSQLPGQSGILPINTVSALIGLPVIFAIILKRKIV